MSLDPKKPIYKCSHCGWIGTDPVILIPNFVCPNCSKILGDELRKMLFVDDRTKRIHYALNNFPEYEVTIATCVPEALRQLSSQDWDVVSLDHDLNGYDFQDPDTPTCGMEIVRYIQKTGWPGWRVAPEFWIHSSNLFAAHLMITTLLAFGIYAYYKPIIYKVENMKYDEKGIPEYKHDGSKF